MHTNGGQGVGVTVATRGTSRNQANRSAAAEERFWAQVPDRPVGGCWQWTGGLHNEGYGRITVLGERMGAHRFAYQLLVGPIPDGLTIDHLCRNRSCVNPAHLEPVTNKENILRGVSPSARHARQTHCKRGHAFTPENTRRDYRDKRVCRTCVRQEARIRGGYKARVFP